MNFIASVVLIAALAAGSMLFSSAAFNPKHLQTLEELEEAAKLLESNEPVLTGFSGKNYARTDLLFGFGRASKSIVCETYFLKLEKDIEEYRKKVASFNDTLVKGKKFFWVNPINGLRSVSKAYSYLDSVTTRYETVDKLTEEDLECDLSKFRVSVVNRMLTVLQADIKHLIVEEPELQLIGIYLQLKEANHVSNHDYYSVDGLKPAQVISLLHYYATHAAKPGMKSINSALGNFFEPNNLVFGRVLDSCRVLMVYMDYWSKLEPYRAEVCEKSELNKQSEESFADEFKLSAYNETLSLCQGLIGNL